MVIQNREWKGPKGQRHLALAKAAFPEIHKRIIKKKVVRFYDWIIIAFYLVRAYYHIRKLPRPQREMTVFTNTKIAIDIFEYVMSMVKLGPRNRLVDFIGTVAIQMLDSNREWTNMVDVVVEQLQLRDWNRRPYLHPSPDFWKEERPYGGFYPIRDFPEERQLFNDVREIKNLQEVETT